MVYLYCALLSKGKYWSVYNKGLTLTSILTLTHLIRLQLMKIKLKKIIKKNYNAYFVGKLRISFLFLNTTLIYLPIIFDVTLLSALST